jgi:hypothetical protein
VNNLRLSARLIGLMGSLLVGLLPLVAQDARDAKGILTAAVQAELTADENDHSRWRYKDADKAANDSVWIAVQTDQGSVKRLIARGGQPLSEAEALVEDQRVRDFIHDSSQLAKQKKDGAQDDKSARELLHMLPEAFNWRVQAEDAQRYTLHFEPNPNFSPPDMQARVLGTMTGEMVVNKEQKRIETISGRLTEDVMIGWGLLGRLREGGTFRVERREIAPKLWQITETHVHIEGKALFFKNIGQQQDEVQTEFTPVPGGTTLEQAAEMSKSLNGATK